ncbi:MAG: 4Fe-4S dicluster domain-containing protein [Deltaproteobacteria bacterium]|nr:4Fe-4S dicluster domain-containing protein [Deltaproteobacteria bacterium]
MSAKTLTQADLASLVGDLVAAGTRVVAPSRTGVGPLQHLDYREIKKADEMTLDAGLPKRSIKELFFPPTEVLFRWKQKKNDFELQEVETKFQKTVVIGARPCDAAAPEIVDRLMNWDYKDELWNGRREATTIVALACDGQDKSCFCTAVGLGPDSTKGADVLLVPVKGGYHAEILTAKGEALVKDFGKRFGEAKSADEAGKFRETARAKVEGNLKVDPKPIRTWLDGHFEDKYWGEIALRCHGCGACASVCPTCHCFDIVDEPEGIYEGARRRNWDTCQTGKFTLHGSGHNPRGTQNMRFRQRVTHKFAIYPRKFEEILCTGCGRCARACPGGMDLLEILSDIGQMAGGAA